MAFQNFYATKLQNSIGASDTTIQVQTPPNPDVTSGRVVINPRNPSQREIIEFTGVSGTNLTGVTRGIGGTVARPHNGNTLVEMNIFAEDMKDLYDYFGTDNVLINVGKLAYLDNPMAVGVLGSTKYYTYNGTSILINGVNQNNLSNSVNWVKPEGLKFIEVELVGGGGGGGNSTGTGSGQHSTTGGGGGGGYAKKRFMASELADTVPLTVGAGAAIRTGVNVTGLSGGASTFMDVTAYGGGGGNGSGSVDNTTRSQTSGGSGGTAEGGDINIAGEHGGSGYGINGTMLRMNSGGGSQLGRPGSLPPYNAPGADGNNYGVGGSGVNAFTNQSALRGGAGAHGIVIIREYY